MNPFEEKIIKGKLTALEVGLQSGGIPMHLIRQEANNLLAIKDITDELTQRLSILIVAATNDEEE